MHTQRAFVVTGIIFHFSRPRFCENPSRPQELDDILHRKRLKYKITQMQCSKNRSKNRRASPSKITYSFLPVPRAGLKQVKTVNHHLKTAGTGAFFLTSLRRPLWLITVGDEKRRCQHGKQHYYKTGVRASGIFLACVIKATNKAPGRPGTGIGISSIPGGECPRDDQVQS